jgi:MFS family permease
VLVGFAAFGAFWVTWGADLPPVQRHAGVDDRELGFALLWIGVGALLTLRPAGTLADRRPVATLSASVALLGVSALGPAFARGAVALSMACAVVGACSGAVDAAVNSAAARWEAAGSRRRIVTLGHGVFSGSVLAASLLVAAALATGSGGRAPLFGLAAILVVAGVGVAALPNEARRPEPVGEFAAGGRRMISRPLLVLGALGAVAYLIENAWQSWSAIQLHSTLHSSASVAAAAPGVFAACAAAGRFGGHGLLRRAPDRLLLAAGAAVAAVGSVLAALAPDPALGLTGIAIGGLGTSVCAPVLIAAAGRTAPHAIGAATGTVITFSYLGFVFGPAIVGAIAGAASLRVALVLVGAAAAVLALCSGFLPRGVSAPPRPSPSDQST